MGVMVSPITGSDGNVEFILVARSAGPTPQPGLDDAALSVAIDEAVAIASHRGARLAASEVDARPRPGGV